MFTENHRIVYTDPETEVLSVIIPAPGVPFEEVRKAIPMGVSDAWVVHIEDMPKDRLFRKAWVREGESDVVKECPVKAKECAHEVRRLMRAKDFAPLDEAIAKRIPGSTYEELEGLRQNIRDFYADMQTQIDSASTTEELRAMLKLS